MKGWKHFLQSYGMYVVLLVALLLRLPYINQSLWLDEAIEALAVRDNSLPQLFTSFMPGDFNPPLHYILLWGWVRMFGSSEIALRLPSVLLGVGVVWFGLTLLKQMLPKKIELQVAGGLLLATSPLLIYYSQEARAYMLATFLASWSMLSLWQYIQEKKSLWRYIIVTSLLLWSHYVAWLLWPIQIILTWVLTKDKKRTLATLLPLVSIIPLLPLLKTQVILAAKVSTALPVWQSLGALSFKNLLLIPAKFLLGRIDLQTSFSFVLILALFLIAYVIVIMQALVKNKLVKDKKLLFLLAWLVGPISLGIVLSIKLALLSYFRYLFVLPAFYLVFVFSLQFFKKDIQKIAFGVFLLLNIVSSSFYLFDASLHREDWKSLVAFIDGKQASSYVVMISSVDAPFAYYDQGKHTLIDYQNIDEIKYLPSVWLITYAQPIFDSQNKTEITLTQEYGFEEISSKTFRGDLVVKYLVNPSGLHAQAL
ncbi:hypothetical protein GYA49_03410 [Candidatus Beckwithbacteria bacterium]|nr:hypothetical protein [Candidatus Beckwithbacteria bacterium]